MTEETHGIRLIHDDVEHVVARRCPVGHPLVLRCRPIRAGSGRLVPFPTLWWLACPQVIEAVSRLEHAGWIHRFEERLAREPEARAEIEADHDAYIAERWALTTEAERAGLIAAGHAASLLERGIGGIRDRRRVKCLHLHVAHHLMRGSLIGRWVDELAPIVPCP